MPPRDLVFVSYSHVDIKYLEELRVQLHPVLARGNLSCWSDQEIKPGSNWFNLINEAISKTAVAVLLVSPSFLCSEFIQAHELGPLLKMAESGGVTILWVLIQDCNYRATPLNHLQALVSPPKPALARMRSPRRAGTWVEICQGICDALNARLANQDEKSRMTVFDPDRSPAPLDHLVVILDQSAVEGVLQNSRLCKYLLPDLREANHLELRNSFDQALIIKGIQLSDEYLARVKPGEEQRDLLWDFAVCTAPVIVAISQTLQRSPESQFFLIQVCKLVASLFCLKIVRPEQPDGNNHDYDALYQACLDATELESDDVLILLKGLLVIGPRKEFCAKPLA